MKKINCCYYGRRNEMDMGVNEKTRVGTLYL
jgi:hypothetical protein